MDFVVKMVIDHSKLGDATVALLGVEKKMFTSYPVEDDHLHVIGGKGLKALPPPSSERQTGISLIMDMLRSRGAHGAATSELKEELVRKGFSPSAVGSYVTKLKDRGLIKQITTGRWASKE